MYEGSLCMCCMATDDLVELFSSRIVNNVEENYAKMLGSGLNIQIAEADGHDWICENCTSKLRDCVEFKRQTFKSMSIISSIQITELANTDDVQVLGLHKCEEQNCYKFEVKTKNDNLEVFEDFQEKKGSKDKGNSKATELAITNEFQALGLRKCEEQKFYKFEIKTKNDNLEVVDDDDFEKEKGSKDKGNFKEEELIQIPIEVPKTTKIALKIKGVPRKQARDYIPYTIGKDEMKCRECGQDFPNNMTLKIHYNTHFRNHVCRTCDKGFVLKRSLKKHETIHLVGPFSCEICGKEFHNLNSMSSHKRYKHGKAMPYRCRECSAGYNTLQQRRDHAAATGHAHIDQQYACRYCDKTFRYSGDRSKHIANKHEVKYFPCPLCGKTFKRGNLRPHLLRRHGIGRGFECTVCQSMQANRSALSVHMKTHLNDRRFICKLCSTAFVQKSALKTHIESHRRCGEYNGDSDYLILHKKDADDKDNGILGDNVDLEVNDYLEANLDLDVLTDQLDLENIEGLLLGDDGFDIPSEMDLAGPFMF